MGFIKDWTLNIVALVMFIIIIEILMPSGRMKKYISFVTGLILIIAIINPILKLVGNGKSLEDIQIFNSNSMDRMEIKINSDLLEKEKNKQIIEVYRKKIIKQLEDSLMKNGQIAEVKGDVIINEDYGSDSFGEIIRAYAEVTLKEKDDEVKPVDKVEKIVIGMDTDDKENLAVLDETLKKQLEDRVTVLFGIDRDKIAISRRMR